MLKSFEGREELGLDESLRAEMSDIFHWALAGWERLRVLKRFTEPESSRGTRETMLDLASPIRGFLFDRCDVGEEYSVPTGELYKAWQEWCQANGKRWPGTSAQFGRDLTAAIPGLKTPRPTDSEGKRIRRYQGVTLSPLSSVAVGVASPGLKPEPVDDFPFGANAPDCRR